MNKYGISLVGLDSKDKIENLIETYPDVLFELSYAMTNKFLQELKHLLKGRVLSVHSLCPRRKYFPNFAALDPKVIKWSENEIFQDIDRAHQFGANIIVLHPGYISNSLIPFNTKIRIKAMGKEFKQYVLKGSLSICKRDYPEIKEYKEAFKIMNENIIKLSQSLKKEGITLAIENLNPRAGYLFVHPKEMLDLAQYEDIHFTLDIGHLWISTELFGINYLDCLKSILATGKVVTTHLHSNPSLARNSRFEDTHSSLDKYFLPYRETLSLISRTKANMILETTEEPLKNFFLLKSFSELF